MPLHVHHRFYRKGKEPWQYEMEDMMVICGTCHESIHENEMKWQIFCRTLPPWVASEFETAVDMLLKLDPDKIAYIGAKLRGLAKTEHYQNQLERIGYEDTDD